MSALRRSVRVHLERGEYDLLLELVAAERGVVRALVSLLCDADELVRWRAVSALGHLAGAHPEWAKPLVTRLYWSLNDESGGIGWMSAPALGEIGRRAPQMLRHCVRPLVRYLDEPFLLPGALWAIGRLAPAYPAETREVVPEVVLKCSSSDPAVRANAARALGEVGDGRACRALTGLADDESPARIYEGGQLVTKQVREWAGQALTRLQAA
ncbi:MAG: DVU0298 family protein [Candidatus Methylomirabilia bacterium]